MAKDFSFYDESLDSFRKSRASRFNKFQQILDETTADIRSLEKWLQSCGICIPVFVSDEREHILRWSKFGDSWRLTYEELKDPESEERPLLDTNAKTRLGCKPLLVDLLEQIDLSLPELPSSETCELAEQESRDVDSIFDSYEEIPF